MRSKQQQGASTDGPAEAAHGSPGLTADLLHHSATRSAFQNFAGIVPRPCDRGDVSAMAQVGSEHLPAARGPACGRLQEIPPAAAAHALAAPAAAAHALAAPAAAAALLAAGLGQQELLQLPEPAAPPGRSHVLLLMRGSCRWSRSGPACVCPPLAPMLPALIACIRALEVCLAVQTLTALPVPCPCCCRCRRQAATSALLLCLHCSCGAAPHDCG